MSNDAPERDDAVGDAADDVVDDLSTPRAANPSTVEPLDRLWDDKPGVWGFLTAVQNDAVGLRMMLTGFFFLLLGGSVDSFVMRLQLARPESELIGAELYNEMFTNHGSVTMFLVILPIFEGFAILTLPMILGAREMPFPRLGAFAYWTFLMGGLLYYSSTLFQAVPNAGWFAYVMPNDVMFVKRFAVDRDRVYNEVAGLTMSIWYPDAPMCELEPIGPRERIAPGQSASFTETWLLLPHQFPGKGQQIDLKKLGKQVNNASR